MTGFAVSLSSLIVVISVMSGFGLSTQNRLLAEEPHLVVYGEDQNRNSFFSSVQKTLSRLENIRLSRSFETQDALLKSPTGSYTGILAKGYRYSDLIEFVKAYENNFLKDTNQNIKWNFSLSNVEKKKWKRFAYLSSDLSFSLSLFEGDVFHVMPVDNLLLPPTEMIPPEEVRLYSSLNFDHFSKISRTLFYEMGTLPSLEKTNSLSYGVEIFLEDPNHFLSYQKVLKENNFKVESWKERHSALFFALKLEKVLMAVFLFLAVLISNFSISSMIRLLLAQKRNDMNILMVMGWPARKVRSLFLKISLTLSFAGMVLGLLMALSICLFLKHNTIPLLPSIYYDRFIPVDMNAFVFIVAALMTFLVAFLISWISVYSYSLPSSLSLKKTA